MRSLTITVSTATAMAGLSIALIAGLLGGNDVSTTLERGLISLVACFVVGLLVGHLLDGVIKRHSEQIRAETDQAEQDNEAVLDPDLTESNVGDSSHSGDGLLAV